ncbi:MAG: nitroreductase family protein [Planctomycetaceae bacterium]|nr:nitroreductase family protein [Planctomycetaceae bacterium]
MKIFLMTALLVCLASTVLAQDITLPAPQRTGGKPVFDAINERASYKDPADTSIDLQSISDLLWAAYGFNREDRRVVPSAMNQQELFVYVVLKEGAYLYDARANTLILKAKGDHRKDAGMQDYVYVAPVNLIYVADLSKETGTGAYISCGCSAQNVYLACASKGLGCAVRTSIPKDELKKLLQLTDQQEPIAGQTIGHKK